MSLVSHKSEMPPVADPIIGDTGQALTGMGLFQG